MSELNVPNLCINSTWTALFIHGFVLIKSWLLLVCHKALYAITFIGIIIKLNLLGKNKTDQVLILIISNSFKIIQLQWAPMLDLVICQSFWWASYKLIVSLHTRTNFEYKAKS